MRSVVRAGIVILGLTVGAMADRVAIVPDTTLTAETGNNTSAADNFPGQANGNLGAGNVGKGPIASLLYPGATTRIYAHFMPWFGGANHVSVGYDSTDPLQVRRQVDDMISRGIRGAIVDWYGPNFARENNTTLALRVEAETRGGNFEFAVMEDVGALNACAATAGCDITGHSSPISLTFTTPTRPRRRTCARMAGRRSSFSASSATPSTGRGCAPE